MQSEPVLAPAIIFSDSANRDQKTGKITLTNIFHRFQSNRFPFESPAFFATAFISNISGKFENLPVTLKITDEHEDEISKAIGHVTTSHAISRNDVAEIAFPVPPTEFARPGYYRAVVSVDDEVLGSRLFLVEELRCGR